MLPHLISYITKTCRIYLWKALFFLSVFLPSGHFRCGPDEYGPGSECRDVRLPVLPMICVPCGHCCEGHRLKVPTDPIQPSCALLARNGLNVCQWIVSRHHVRQRGICSRKLYAAHPEKGLLSERLTGAQMSPCPMLWGVPGLWHEDLRE